MQAKDIPLRELLEGSKQFIIPVFQRDYRWNDDQCEQLWNDVIRVGSDAKAVGHFIGSVVYIQAGGSDAAISRWLLIDGQQRLTTVTLMFIALRDRLRQKGSDEPNPEEIHDLLLRNPYAKGELMHRLRLRGQDAVTLAWLMDRKDPNTAPAPGFSERVFQNYTDFLDRLKEVDLGVVYVGLHKLVLVHAILTPGQDDPQMIFESLNSTGLDLSQADLVRNYVLMRHVEAEQTRLYLEHWQPIEADFGNSYSEGFDGFLNTYLTLQTGRSKPLRADTIYAAFKEWFQAATRERTMDQVLGELRRYAKYYSNYALEQEPREALRKQFKRLSDLVDVAAPVVLRLYHLNHFDKTLTDEDFVEAIKLMESYVIRRAVCDLETRGQGSIMATIAKGVRPEDPLLSLKVVLARRSESQRFPDDYEFRNQLTTRDVYSMKIKHYLLTCLENHDTKEPAVTSSYTVEHIMPQNKKLRTEWREMLGEHWESVHTEWLHRIGNLSLTGYNSEYRDYPFDTKKTCKGGFNDSPLRLNQWVKQQSKWTKTEMEQRGADLATTALNEWPQLDVPQAEITKAQLRERQEAGAQFNESTLEMSAAAQVQYKAFSTAIKERIPNIVEVFSDRNVTYHAPVLIVELIPRASNVILVFNLEHAQCVDPSSRAQDTTDRKSVQNSHVFEPGMVLFRLDGEEALSVALDIAEQTLHTVQA